MSSKYKLTLMVEQLTDLNKLLTAQETYTDIQFAHDLIPEEQTENIKRRLMSYHNSCGCGAGNLFAVFVMIFVTPALISLYKLDYLPLWQVVTLGFIVMIASAGIGKFVGLWRARTALKLEINKLLPR